MEQNHNIQVGDIVELVDSSAMNARKGNRAKVLSVHNDMIEVEWLDKNINQLNGEYYSSRFKLSERPPQGKIKYAAQKALDWFKWQSGEEPSQDDRPLSAPEVKELLEKALNK